MSRISEQLKASNWDNLLTLGSLQFRSFLVYWSKLTKCLCYQMLKVHSACGIEHQVLSGVEAGLGSGFQNTTVTCQTQKNFVRHVRSGENCSAGRLLMALLLLLMLRWRKAARQLFRQFIPVSIAPPPTLATVSHPPTFHKRVLCWCARVTLS